MVQLLISVVLMVIASGACSGTEIALYKVSVNKARQMYADGQCSKIFINLIENRDEYVKTITYMNNIVNLLGTMYITKIATEQIDNGALFGAFSAFFTLSVIIFAEIIPKIVASNKSIPVMKKMSGVVVTARWVLTPAIVITSPIIDYIVKKLLGDIKEESISEAEIGFLVKEASKDIGSDIRQSEAELIESVFKIHDTTAKDIMTPSTKMTKLSSQDKLSDIIDKAIKFEHTRIIITGENDHDIQGIVIKEDLMAAYISGQQDMLVGDLKVRKIRQVREGTSAESLLRILRSTADTATKNVMPQIAIVSNEFGVVSGIVTLEDVLEILVGEIVDETDRSVDLQEEARIDKRAMINQ